MKKSLNSGDNPLENFRTLLKKKKINKFLRKLLKNKNSNFPPLL